MLPVVEDYFEIPLGPYGEYRPRGVGFQFREVWIAVAVANVLYVAIGFARILSTVGLMDL